jgi:hypothetical protein
LLSGIIFFAGTRPGPAQARFFVEKGLSPGKIIRMRGEYILKGVNMRLRSAAVVGRILVVAHLAITLAIMCVNIVRHGVMRPNVEMAIQMALSIAAAVFLDLALILVFSALARTKEQQVLDGAQ